MAITSWCNSLQGGKKFLSLSYSRNHCLSSDFTEKNAKLFSDWVDSLALSEEELKERSRNLLAKINRRISENHRTRNRPFLQRIRSFGVFYNIQEDARCTCHTTRQYCAPPDDFKKTIFKKTTSSGRRRRGRGRRRPRSTSTRISRPPRLSTTQRRDRPPLHVPGNTVRHPRIPDRRHHQAARCVYVAKVTVSPFPEEPRTRSKGTTLSSGYGRLCVADRTAHRRGAARPGS